MKFFSSSVLLFTAFSLAASQFVAPEAVTSDKSFVISVASQPNKILFASVDLNQIQVEDVGNRDLSTITDETRLFQFPDGIPGGVVQSFQGFVGVSDFDSISTAIRSPTDPRTFITELADQGGIKLGNDGRFLLEDGISLGNSDEASIFVLTEVTSQGVSRSNKRRQRQKRHSPNRL